MSDFVIQTSGLTRFYGNRVAVNHVNLSVPRGSVTALLGRNGSGKTTTIRMLLGLVPPTRGTATVLGCNSQRLTPAMRSRIGYLSESHFAYRWMRIRETAEFQQGTFPRWNPDIFNGIVDHFGLDKNAKVGSLSRGERAGVCLALTLATEPELLILDDPALGLDPVARRSLVEAMLAVTRHRDRTILFSSHLLDDVERVADHIAIIDQGVLRVQAPVEEFRNRVSLWRLTFDTLPSALPPVPGLIHTQFVDHEIHITIANANADTLTALQETGAIHIEETGLSLDRAVIDFLTVRGRTGSLLQAVGSRAPSQHVSVSVTGS